MFKSFLKWIRNEISIWTSGFAVDMRVWDDPAWLIGGEPKPETVELIKKTQK